VWNPAFLKFKIVYKVEGLFCTQKYGTERFKKEWEVSFEYTGDDDREIDIRLAWRN
jgi:hypothetical protein